MLEFFRKNYFINNILLLPYIFLVRVGLFFDPQNLDFSKKSEGVVKFIYPWLDNVYVNIVATNLLIFLHALILNYMFLNHKLSKNTSLFAGLFYVLWVSLVFFGAGLTDALIANTFVIIAIRNIWRSYKQAVVTSQIFKAGFMLGLAGLIFPPYYIFIVFAVIGLYIIKSVRILDLAQLLVSFCVPLFLFFTYNYWRDQPFNPMSFLNDYTFYWPSLDTNGSLLFYMVLGLFFLFTVLSFFWYSDLQSRKNIEAQKKIDTLYWFILFIVIAFLSFSQYGSSFLLVLAIPLSFFLGIKVSDSKNKLTYEFVHLLFLGIIISSQFGLF